MLRPDPNDTIVAIATAPGASGIGIVRISGGNALAIADRVFRSKDGRKPSQYASYSLHYGWATERQEDQGAGASGVIDEVLLTVMRAPRSYTKEDVVEINCHGGITPLRRILDVVLNEGCRLAEPGEFTKRAFLNGRIDLAQAEAVLDIIQAKSDKALQVGVSQLKGGLSRKINKLREELLDILAALEAAIDFPEEEVDTQALSGISRRLRQAYSNIKELAQSAKFGAVLREGVHVVICGKPNVGKSSLLNALLRQERAIVTPVAGTTRDTIEEIIDIRGIPVRIVDTAGIVEPRDLIEKKAVRRSRGEVEKADLLLLIFDGSSRLSRGDLLLMRRLRHKPVIPVINKIDLEQKIDKKRIVRDFGHLVEISAKKGRHIDLLEEALVNAVFAGKAMPEESRLLSNARHIRLVKEAQKLIAEADKSVDNKLSWEYVSQGLKGALSCLDEVLGKKFSADLLDKIFQEFCIGK